MFLFLLFAFIFAPPGAFFLLFLACLKPPLQYHRSLFAPRSWYVSKFASSTTHHRLSPPDPPNMHFAALCRLSYKPRRCYILHCFHASLDLLVLLHPYQLIVSVDYTHRAGRKHSNWRSSALGLGKPKWRSHSNVYVRFY